MPAVIASQHEPVLLCRGLVKRYPDVLAVDHLDLEVEAGECFGLLGPNGAGKTTTIEILEGLTPPDAGEVAVLGRRWGTNDRELRARGGRKEAEHEPARAVVARDQRLRRPLPRPLALDRRARRWMKVSTGIAAIVIIWTDPRAPSSIETLATVSLSGASMTVTKS